MYVTSAEGGTGKSTIAVGLLETLKGSVARVGVFRPISRSGPHRDYVLEMLLEHASAQLDYEACVGTTYPELHENPDAALAQVVDRFGAMEDECDAVVILGSDYTDVGSPTELATNARIAANLAAQVLLVLGGRGPGGEYRSGADLAGLARVSIDELHNEHAAVLAVIVNRVEPSALGDVAAAVTSTEVPGWALPEDAELTAPLLRYVLAAADATMISGDKAALDRPVRDTVVAAMSVENVLPRLTEGAVVVVPGDRSEVVLAAVMAHLSKTFPMLAGLILNGGFPVAPAVQQLMDGLGATLPIATNNLGTFDTAVRITHARSRLAADSPQKYATALSLFEQHVDAAELVRRLSLPTSLVMTPLRFEHMLIERARSKPRHIVLPEGDDDRVLQAAGIVLQRGIAELTILGEEPVVRARAAQLGVDIAAAHVISVTDHDLHERFTDVYAEARKHKGISRQAAADTVTDGSYFGTMMVHLGLADGMVSGAKHTTANTIRPGFEIVKTSPGVSVVSSVFLMALADRVLVYGDCAVIPEPTVEQLADIAISSAATARQFGIEPRVAMLSYSTGDSGTGAEVDRVRAATALVKQRAPELPVAGPIQYDAAADPTVGESKLPGSDVAGRATVFIFPDLNTGNNTYKAVQRSSGAVAIGPVLQGLAKPINDLSRGALVRDIVNTIAITAIQAQGTS
ncbi:MAG: phosphate acetyltransferase [Pseudolysinimonas sp.]